MRKTLHIGSRREKIPGICCGFIIFEDRQIIYATNMIEDLNRQFRQITKSKPSFTSDDSLRRMLYLASQRITKRWRTRCQNRDLVLSPTPVPFHRTSS